MESDPGALVKSRASSLGVRTVPGPCLKYKAAGLDLGLRCCALTGIRDWFDFPFFPRWGLVMKETYLCYLGWMGRESFFVIDILFFFCLLALAGGAI